MSAKHTLGPWRIAGKGAIRAGESAWVADVNWHNREANARLIAAAPELLEALILAREELERYEEDRTGERYNNTVINAAIAKAVSS